MFKKVLLSSSVLFGLLFFAVAGECFAKHLYRRSGLSDSERADLLYQHVTGMWPADEIWSQMRVAMTNIADGNDAAAQATIDKLRTDFSENQYLPVALFEIAKLYRLVGERNKSLQLHQYVIDNWPSHEYTMWSLKDVAILNIALGNLEAAQAAVDNVLAKFASQKHIAFVVYKIAEHYREYKNYEKAKQLYQYLIDHWPEDDCAVSLQSILVRLYIDTGNETAAQAAIDKLLSDFSETKNIRRGVYKIAKHYRELEKYERAKPLYQYVVDNLLGDSLAMRSQSGLAQCYIAFDEPEAAEAAGDILIANYQFTNRIDKAVHNIADQYNRFGRYAKAKQLYQYILDTWPDCEVLTWTKIGLALANIRLGNNATAETILDGLVAKLNTDFPSDSNLPVMAGQTYHDAGNLYRQIGKYQKSILCHQKVVDDCPDYEYAWYAQYMIGLNCEILKKSEAISASEADTKIRAAYEQLLTRYPNCPGAAHAREWLNLHNTP